MQIVAALLWIAFLVLIFGIAIYLGSHQRPSSDKGMGVWGTRGNWLRLRKPTYRRKLTVKLRARQELARQLQKRSSFRKEPPSSSS